jgi:chorismate synthase
LNTFGRFFRISILGESHGPCVGVLIDGCPAGLDISIQDFATDLKRRQSGQPGTTARQEEDIPRIMAGLFNGKTTGAPLLVMLENRDTDSAAYERIRQTPRPGHADFVAFRKYGGLNDYRGGGIFSGRLTAALVAAGVVAKKLIEPIRVEARLLEAGGSTEVEAAVRRALEQEDSIGGLVECRANGLPIGLGEPFFDSVESLLSHLIFSIPGIKGIEFGSGFACARMSGSAYNDQIMAATGETRTNNAGGINGGITNGNELVLRVAVKPTSSISKTQQTIDMETGEQRELAIGGRHDTCIALRVPIIVEAATAVVIADLMLLEQKIPRILR